LNFPQFGYFILAARLPLFFVRNSKAHPTFIKIHTPERTKSKKGKICYMEKKKMKGERRTKRRAFQLEYIYFIYTSSVQKLPFLSFKRSKRVPLSINILRGKEPTGSGDSITVNVT